MRSSVLFTAAFAAVALASPILDARGEIVVTDNEVVYVTDIVTITEGQAAPTTPPAVTSVTSTQRSYGGRRHRKHRSKASAAPAPSAPAYSAPAYSAPPSSAPAPVPSSEAPAPAPSSYEQPTPQPSSEAPAPAPTSYQQPTPAPSSSAAPVPVPAPSSSQAPPPAYTPPATGVATTYKDAVLLHHNCHRANYSSADLKWSDALAATAKKIADTCVYKHNTEMDGGGYGQNIAAGQSAGYIGSIISDQFYNGEVNAFAPEAGKANPSMTNFGAWGHLSQIVWKSTTEVGCYTTSCTGGLSLVDSAVGNFFTVCNYKEPGNMAGAYAENIGSCLDKPTISGDYNVDPEQIAKNMPQV